MKTVISRNLIFLQSIMYCDTITEHMSVPLVIKCLDTKAQLVERKIIIAVHVLRVTFISA